MTMDRNEGIFSGPNIPEDIPEGSISQFLFEKASNVQPGLVTQINGDTDESMTHKEFTNLVYQVGAGLASHGVKTGDIVIVFGENNFRGSAVATACFLLNAPFAPVDRLLKSFELRNIISSYRPKLILCNHEQVDYILSTLAFLEMDVPVILLNRDESGSENPNVFGFSSVLQANLASIEPKPVKDPSTEIAIVLPSSGSTGMPKGIALSHCSLLKFCNGILKNPMFGHGPYLQGARLFWITGTYGLVQSVMGHPRVFINNTTGDNFIKVIRKYKPTFTFLGAPTFSMILDSVEKPDDLSSLRSIMLGGSPLRKGVLNKLHEKIPNPPRIINGYGVTENIGGAALAFPPMDLMSVGKVLPNQQIKIVDPNTGVTLKQGLTGEICIKNRFQMVGYINNEVETKATFDKDGWLLTGDVGYFNDEELLYVTGRKKTTMICRGLQVSPELIESLLSELPGVVDVGVCGILHPEEYFKPVALIVKAPGADLTEDDVHKYVEKNLAPHNQLRAGVFFVDSVPRTGSWKIKRPELASLAREIYDRKEEQLKVGK